MPQSKHAVSLLETNASVLQPAVARERRAAWYGVRTMDDLQCIHVMLLQQNIRTQQVLELCCLL